MSTRRYCFTLDLKNDPELIAGYDQWHREVWPEILKSIRDAGIEQLEIYRIGTRLMMIIEVDETFSFEKKALDDESNPNVQAWEKLMWNYQEPLPGTAPGEKWVLMNRIFKFDINDN